MFDRLLTAGSVCVALVALAPARAAAADPPEQDFQIWDQIYLDANLDPWAKGLRTFMDLQVRRMNAPLNYLRDADGNIVEARQNPNTLLMVRPAIGYAWASWGSAFVGYAWVPNYFDDPAAARTRNIDEHRIFEQFNFRWGIPGRLDLSTRIRVEQRFRSKGPGSGDVVDGVAQDGGKSRWAFRYRQQIRLAFNFVQDQPWQLIVWDEPFFHLNSSNYPSEPGLDHNRAFLGFGYDARRLRVEAGYINQYVRRFSDPHQLNHIFSLNLVIKLGGRKSSQSSQ
ncbi:MAG TPA: DUF2490 domain-containing protein [Enhygromyxa sp.]|nr:DUF2490 domain-containing protein [Enhygromyxa sp.]